MPTLTPLLASVNESQPIPYATSVVSVIVVLALLTLAAAGQIVRQALAVVVQLIETALAICLVSILVLAAVFAAGYLFATR